MWKLLDISNNEPLSFIPELQHRVLINNANVPQTTGKPFNSCSDAYSFNGLRVHDELEMNLDGFCHNWQQLLPDLTILGGYYDQ
jgi:hypothetical protein